jgi:3-hydroxyisobutyrate dehydrogenase-like beta-hydroxyacid dehydrogenase
MDSERLAEVTAAGAEAGADVADVVTRCEVIATSLPSSESWVEVAESAILPHARAGQLFIDFGTVTPPETRRLAARFAEHGVDLIDSPVSGGGRGAEQAQLYMFVGGAPEAFERCRPILEIVGGSDRITYCGPAGSGQVVKGVNQLMMGIVEAAYLEAIAFGVNSGVDIEVIERAIGNSGRWRVDFNQTARRILDGQGTTVGVKFRELPYFLRAAEHDGFDLPITQVVRSYCEEGERVAFDDHRKAPSYWHELMQRRTAPSEAQA